VGEKGGHGGAGEDRAGGGAGAGLYVSAETLPWAQTCACAALLVLRALVLAPVLMMVDSTSGVLVCAAAVCLEACAVFRFLPTKNTLLCVGGAVVRADTQLFFTDLLAPLSLLGRVYNNNPPTRMHPSRIAQEGEEGALLLQRRNR
jgi:hypothetical protein